MYHPKHYAFRYMLRPSLLILSDFIFFKLHCWRVCVLQVVGAAVVSMGVCVAAWPSQAGSGVFSQVRPASL